MTAWEGKDTKRGREVRKAEWRGRGGGEIGRKLSAILMKILQLVVIARGGGQEPRVACAGKMIEKRRRAK